MANRIKVLFVLPNLFGGGAERVFTHLINGIDRSKFEPHLALGSWTGAYAADVNADVTIHELGGERARTAVPSLVKLVRRLRPGTVFSTLGMNLANAAGKTFYPSGTRVVLREGNSVTAFFKDVERGNPAMAFVYRKVYRLLYNRTDAVICQSDFMLRDIADNFSVRPELLHRIHNPVDFAKITAVSAEAAPDVFPNGAFNFVTVGKFHYHKGFDVLLRAFALARKADENISLLILGEGEERRNLERLRSELKLDDAVAMPGFVKDPYAHISRADAFVSSSRYEGFSNVIVEALACGTPVVATDCPSANREVIEENLNGWFARVDDDRSLADALLLAVGERKNLDSERIRADCESRFSIERILPLYEAILEG